MICWCVKFGKQTFLRHIGWISVTSSVKCLDISADQTFFYQRHISGYVWKRFSLQGQARQEGPENSGSCRKTLKSLKVLINLSLLNLPFNFST